VREFYHKLNKSKVLSLFNDIIHYISIKGTILKNILLSLFLFISLTGCNVGSTGSVTIPTSEGNTTEVPDENTTEVPDENTTEVPDENTTEVPDENTTVIEQPNGGTDTEIESIFDDTDAIYDAIACGAFDGYTAMKDNSLDPEGNYDEVHLITVGSSYPPLSASETEVTLFRPDLSQTETNSISTKYEDNYYISYDIAWVNNSNNTFYLKTPIKSNNLYDCYRYVFNTTDTNDINATKVYR